MDGTEAKREQAKNRGDRRREADYKGKLETKD